MPRIIRNLITKLYKLSVRLLNVLFQLKYILLMI